MTPPPNRLEKGFVRTVIMAPLIFLGMRLFLLWTNRTPGIVDEQLNLRVPAPRYRKCMPLVAKVKLLALNTPWNILSFAVR